MRPPCPASHPAGAVFVHAAQKEQGAASPWSRLCPRSRSLVGSEGEMEGEN